jgi:hypothetical protein
MRFLFFLLCVLVAHLGAAQSNLPLGEVAVAKDDAFREAVSEGIYMLRQSYLLRSDKSGIEYGRESRDIFGSAYTFGILLNGRVFFSPRLLQPWHDDPYYVKVDSLNEKRTEKIDFRPYKQNFASFRSAQSPEGVSQVRLASLAVATRGFEGVGRTQSGRLAEILVKKSTEEGEPILYEIRISPASWGKEGGLIIPKFSVKNDKQLSVAFLFSEEITLGNIKILPVGMYCQDGTGNWAWHHLKDESLNDTQIIATQNTVNQQNESGAEILSALKENLKSSEELLKMAGKTKFSEAEKKSLKSWKSEYDVVYKRWKKSFEKLLK